MTRPDGATVVVASPSLVARPGALARSVPTGAVAAAVVARVDGGRPVATGAPTTAASPPRCSMRRLMSR
jgi:hypothetical protein